jgi:glc operon protein GlcG
MKTKSFLELADVKAIAAAAEAEALKNNWAVTIAIVDDGGHLLWLQRLDGAAALSAHIAPAKANTAALGRRESKVYEDIINGGRAFLSAPEVQGLLEGGVPIVKDGQCIGAVGVSGVKSNEDAQIAKRRHRGARPLIFFFAQSKTPTSRSAFFFSDASA